MPHLILPLGPGGALIDVVVGVSTARAAALQKASQGLPAGAAARALIDTGASCTCVDPRITRALSLSPTGRTSIRTPSTGAGVHHCDLYDVSLSLVQPVSHVLVPALGVIETSLAAQGIECLIGRDVLSSCLLIYDGRGGTFTLAF